MLLYYLVIITALGNVECFQKQIPNVFKKLEGKWQRIGKPDNFEYWENTGGILISESFRMEDGQKYILEKTTIEYLDNSWFFIPDVPHNPAPVPFRISEIGDNFFYSENAEHDFPKWIRYELLSADSLEVLIGDQKDTVKFDFTRTTD